MSSLKQRMLNLLEETVQYYSEDVSRRATETFSDGHTYCKYLTNDGRMCAVGRCLTEDSRKKSENSIAAIYNLVRDGSVVFQERYDNIPTGLWVSLQCLHDSNNYWTDQGLSSEGECYMSQIEEKILGGYYCEG